MTHTFETADLRDDEGELEIMESNVEEAEILLG